MKRRFTGQSKLHHAVLARAGVHCCAAEPADPIARQ